RKSTSLHDRIFNAIAQKMREDASSNFTVRNYIVTNKEKLVMNCNIAAKDVVVKIPLNEASLFAQQKNKELLIKMAGLSVSPDFVCQVEEEGLQGFVEEEIKGNPISSLFLP